jgi:hypothetical protein
MRNAIRGKASITTGSMYFIRIQIVYTIRARIRPD